MTIYVLSLAAAILALLEVALIWKLLKILRERRDRE